MDYGERKGKKKEKGKSGNMTSGKGDTLVWEK